jgi:telomere-associated protein RIF1
MLTVKISFHAKNIFSCLQVIGDQLTEWLSLSGTYYCEMQQGETIYQLERLWIKTVERLKTSQVIKDGSFFPHQKLLQAALNHPHHSISKATASVWRPATSNQQHLGCLASKLDELLSHGPNDFNNLGDANKIVHERINISKNIALPIPEKRTIPSNETEFNEINGGFLKISVGLRRKRLKISKYPTKPMELGKHAAPFRRPSPRMDTNGFSPCCMENKVCRKPELILEMLKNKR